MFAPTANWLKIELPSGAGKLRSGPAPPSLGRRTLALELGEEKALDPCVLNARDRVLDLASRWRGDRVNLLFIALCGRAGQLRSEVASPWQIATSWGR